MNYVNILIVVWNIFVFSIYGIDKYKARRGLYRISEASLILPAFLLSSIGAMLGMIVFNHKTSKTKFRTLIPLSFVFNVAVLSALKYLM